MALFLEKTLYNGVEVRYHRITSYTLDPQLGLATATIESFYSREVRGTNTPGEAKEEFTFDWSGSGETLAQEAYAYIKSQPGWEGAVDV